MIVAIKNNKIIGVEKELLNQLNATLENLSEKINTLNLIISSIKNTPIKIDNKEFEVKEIEFLTLEDIKLYDLSLIKTSFEEPLNIEQTQESFMPTDMEIKPLNESFESITPVADSSSQMEIKEFPQPIESQHFESEIKPTQEVKELNLESFNLETPVSPIEEIAPKEEIQQPQENIIVLTFEDEFKEIDELLNLKSNEIQNLLQEDLKKASQELGVDTQTINELFETLLEQIKENKDEFYNAIKEKNYEKLHKIAHSLKGASLNLRLSHLALILKYIDEKSKEKIPIEKLELLINKFYKFVEKLTTKPQQNQLNIDENTKNLILMTIENYLKTQNEKQFKKDLKYIQKILGVNISNIDELQEIMKGIK